MGKKAKKEDQRIDKNLNSILQTSYTIPFYQRNYSWGVLQISQFIQDIYDSFAADVTQNYYIGSLIVHNRTQEILEVIDGQQRLTTIHLIWYLIRDESISDFKSLKYDSRKEVEAFYSNLYEQGMHYKVDEKDFTEANLINFIKAIEIIKSCKLKGEIESDVSFQQMNAEELSVFRNYLLKKVMLIEVLMPHYTDVTSYFEIMNNRGKQLEEHEIIKARLMANLKPTERQIFGNVWDACSQMDRPIQKFFTPEQRLLLFGENYQEVKTQKISDLRYSSVKIQHYSVIEILNNKAKNTEDSIQGEKEYEMDDDISYSPIIDFPNFLIHIFKLSYVDAEIPLSSDKLLKIYNSIQKEVLRTVNPMQFLKNLFYYRVIFDRYVVKSIKELEEMDLDAASQLNTE
ncbi:MAG TPA: DUF262 domain-containing protein, partial [Emticicia sp.]